MHLSRLSISLLGITLLLPMMTIAQHSEAWLSTRTPGAESAMTLGQSELAIETGLAYSRPQGDRYASDNHWGTSDRERLRIYEWPFTLTFGMTNQLDLSLTSAWVDMEDASNPYNDKHGRGLDDLTVAMKYGFYSDEHGIKLAYKAGFGMPSGKRAQEDHLGPGTGLWSLDQQLMATKSTEMLTLNMNVGHWLPLSETRDHYSRTFGQRANDTRGITNSDLVMLVNGARVEPMVGVHYAHEWISGGNDSDLVTASAGARMRLNERNLLALTWEEPVAGRNTARLRTVGLSYTFVF